MAAKNWINSYLATLDVVPGIDDSKSSLLLRERGKFSPTRYFVDQVIGFDEVDLYSYWVEAAYTRNPPERNTRLENMCWRIWNLARQKKQLEGEEAQRQVERERGRGEATADTFEDLTEGKKGDTGGDLSAVDKSHSGQLPRITDVEKMEACADQHKGKKLYIVLISLHGLVRGENMELGRDSDTGGQVKYVVELARALGSMQGVHRVDLLTRQVFAPDVDWSYGEATEMLPPRNSDGLMNDMGDSNGAYIIRVPFGPRNKYLPKESLWPYIPEFVDGALKHILQTSKVLGEHIGSGHPVWPVAIHGHYADAGDAAARLSGALNVPMVFTGHSHGRYKLEQLLRQGRLSKDEINATYKVMRRIEAEELALDASETVITSTGHEIELWRLYDGFDPVLERKLRARIRRNVSCYGRFMPRIMLNPPRMEFHDIVPYDGDMYGETRGNDDQPTSEDPPIWTEIKRFFSNPYKPMIIAVARPDPETNLTTLVEQFGECRPLRELANLTLIMGNRDDVDEMPRNNASVFLSILKLIDKYDLYGQVAYPKHHKKSDVPDIYRLAVMTKGVFVSLALSESFGLTLIEAAAYGLPIVATKISVHEDMQKVLDNGILVGGPDKEESISLGVESSILGKESLGEESIGLVEESFGLGEESIGMHESLSEMSIALIKLVSDKQLWAKCRLNGLKNVRHYSWPEHCKTYLSRIVGFKQRHPSYQKFKQRHPWCPRSDEWDENAVPDSPSDSLRDIQDISLNLKFSMDGEKNSGSDNAFSSLVSDDRKSKLENDVSTQSKRDHNSSTGKFPVLRRRKHMIVIAVDFGDISDLYSIARKIFDAVEKERTEGSIGFILSTSFTLAEIHSFLISARLHPTEFDAFICNSGSDIYYSSPNPENNPFIVDWYYHSHIKYRWGGEGLRKTLVRWAGSIIDKKGENEEQVVTEEEQVVTEDEKISTNYCYSFKVRNPGKVPPVKEVRKYMRIQALRCHVVYCQNGNKINVIPLLASRSLALRFLYIQWAVDLSKMVVFVGESGDTDYEGLLGGIHKSVVLKGVSAGATNQLHANRNYLLSDVMPIDSPNIVQATEDCSSDGIRTLLEKLGFLKG